MKESDARPFIDNQAVFDALPARIVVVAADGVILASNRAWQQYLDENRGITEKVNDNYYNFWTSKTRVNQGVASEVLAGVKAVQTGSQAEFSLKYSCAVATGEYWCKLEARPLGDGQGSVVVAHEVLTEKPASGTSHFENEARLRTLLNATPDGVVFKDGSGRWLMANHAAMDHLGLDPHDYQYKTSHELALQFPQLRTFHESSIKSDQQAWEAGKTFRVLEPIPQGEGGVRFVDITKVPLFNPDGSRLGLVIMGRDVSDRLESESALRAAQAELEQANARLELRVAERTRELVQSEARFRAMFDRHVAVMLLIEPETGAIRDANAAAARFYGYSREQLCSLLVCAINPLPPEELAALRAGAMAGRQNFFILPQRAAHGRMYECEIYSTPIQTGGETLLFSIIHDVSARRQAEAQLQKLSQAVEQSPGPVVIMDVHGRIEFVNPAFTHFTGYTAAEAIGHTHRLLQSGMHPREFYEAIWTVLRSGQAWRGEICDRKKNGDLYWKLISIAPVRNAQGEIINYVSTELDITEQRETHERLRQAKEAADVASQAKSTFLASMSHEIRTPMNSILGYAQVLQRDPSLPAAAQEKVQVINRSGEHLLTMINDVLEMSKIEAGRVVIQPVSFNLHDLLNDLAAMLQLRAGAKGLEFKVVDATDLPGNVLADIGKIRQVLLNLIGNAVKFTERGQIEMRAASRPEPAGSEGASLWLTIEIEDTGPGISPLEITQLFQQFVQTSSGRKHHSGTGLGLTISREYARLMGGDITVTSQEGRGSCFKFEIPIRLAPVETSSPRRIAPRVTGLQPGQAPLRVLVAEDDRDNGDWLNQLLTLVGCEVRQVADGAAAVQACETWTPQLILMDLQMPVMDGYEATRRIKAGPAGDRVVVLAVTATVFEETRQTILAAGARDMLAKPVDEHQLFNQIRQHLGVKFRTEEEVSPASVSDFNPEAIAQLPAKLRDELQAATFNGDSEQLAGLLDEVATHNAPLAEFLRSLADRYDYIALARHLGQDD